MFNLNLTRMKKGIIFAVILTSIGIIGHFGAAQSKTKSSFLQISDVEAIIDIKSLNCEIDSVDRFLLSPPDGLYPVIVYLKEGEIQNIDIQNPQNANVLKSLSDIL